jgi:hypothetical protein
MLKSVLKEHFRKQFVIHRCTVSHPEEELVFQKVFRRINNRAVRTNQPARSVRRRTT